jgi:hypothetical protein
MADHEHAVRIDSHERAISMRYVLGGSLSEGLAGAGAVAVAIIALASGSSATLMSIATILVGAALVFEGAAISARFNDLMHETSDGGLSAVEFGAGTTAQVVGGMAVVTLGILALLGLSPTELVAVAAIVAGGAVLLGSGTTSRMNALRIDRSKDSAEAQGLAHAAVSSAAGTQLFLGVGAIALGILAVLNISPSLLSIIAMLATGFAVLMSGSALSGLGLAARR